MAQASSELNVVTGAFGYSGRYIARRLLALSQRVMTITGRPERPNPFGNAVRAAPFNFDRPAVLAKSLEGATTLYSTYWVRFSHGRMTFDRAVENTKTLIKAAEEAGLRRIVHLSITQPSADSHLPYFRGKAILETAIRGSKLSYAIIRPAVIFGDEDILINNIAWILRHLPVFGVPGKGDYRLQPVFAEDLAEIVVTAGQRDDNLTLDAVGPQVFTFDELVRLIASAIGSRAKIVHLPAGLAFVVTKLVGWFVRDVILTRDELAGLMANLLISNDAPTGGTHLSDWLARNANRVGSRYASELARHFR